MISLLKLLLFQLSFCLHSHSVQVTMYPCDRDVPCGCSRHNVHIKSPGTGGQPAISHSWGWSVSLRVLNEIHFCGGVILSEHHILTAAHCVHDPEIKNFDLRAAIGTDTLADHSGRRHRIAEVILHPLWTSRTNINDIAVLRLEQPIDFRDHNLARICLPSIHQSDFYEFPPIKSSLIAVYWSYMTSYGTQSEVLRQMLFETIAQKHTQYHSLIENDQLQFCAVPQNASKGMSTHQ